MNRVASLTLLAVLVTACGGGGGGGASPTPVSPPPTVTGTPTALINAPKSVIGYSTVTLDGSLSREGTANVSLTNFAWSQTAGPSVNISNNNAAQASFTAPQVTASTTLSFSLEVTDSAGANSTATASVNVLPTSSTRTQVAIVSATLLSPLANNFHVDAVPSAMSPLAGATTMIQVSMSGFVQSPTFTLVDANGNNLGSAPLTLSGSSSVQPLDFVGTITLPSKAFAVNAAGTTADGQTFNVTSSSLGTPNTFAVGFVPARTLVKPGASFVTQLQITNQGPSGTFLLILSDPSGLLNQTLQQSVQVNQAQTLSIPVTVTMPAKLAHTFAPKVTAVVVSAANPSQGSGAILTVLFDGAP